MEAIGFPIVRKDEIWTEKVYEVNVPSLTGEARALSIKYFLFKNKDTQTATQQKTHIHVVQATPKYSPVTSQEQKKNNVC